MALSGSNTGALLPYTARSLLEEAASRAGVSPERLTSEIIYKTLDNFNLLLTGMLNRGIQLWKRHQFLLPVYEGVNQLPMPPGFNLVTSLSRRTMTRQLGGTAFSDAGGTAALAFDDDLSTACVQTSANGSVGMVFSNATVVTQIGVYSQAAGTYGLFYEYSNDGTNWTALGSETVTFVGNDWFWVDLQASPVAGALQWRVRTVGTVPFAPAEIFFGNLPNDVLLPPFNVDDYSNMPNKFTAGTITAYYQQRDIEEPTIYVWQMPAASERYTVLYMWATQYLEQVTDINQAIDFPPRWYEAVTAMMAMRLCRILPEADYTRLNDLKADAAEALSLAEGEERDIAPTNYDFGLLYYTSM